MVPAQPEPKTEREEHEVLLYINSESGSAISETLLFKILVRPSA
jgi:hypothetical protein